MWEPDPLGKNAEPQYYFFKSLKDEACKDYPYQILLEHCLLIHNNYVDLDVIGYYSGDFLDDFSSPDEAFYLLDKKSGRLVEEMKTAKISNNNKEI